MAATVMKPWMAMTNFLRSTRSPITPAQGPTIRVGRVVIPPTVTTKSPDDAKESVRSRTSQPTESSCSHWAVLAKKLPTHRKRKSR